MADFCCNCIHLIGYRKLTGEWVKGICTDEFESIYNEQILPNLDTFLKEGPDYCCSWIICEGCCLFGLGVYTNENGVKFLSARMSVKNPDFKYWPIARIKKDLSLEFNEKALSMMRGIHSIE